MKNEIITVVITMILVPIIGISLVAGYGFITWGVIG